MSIDLYRQVNMRSCPPPSYENTRSFVIIANAPSAPWANTEVVSFLAKDASAASNI